MELAPHSRNRILNTFFQWDVPKDFAEPMYNYLVHGFTPGSCFTAVLANDFQNAIGHSHPANTITAFKALAGWIRDTVPLYARGTYKAVENWIKLSDAERRAVLEEHELIYPEQEEILLILRNTYTNEPILW